MYSVLPCMHALGKLMGNSVINFHFLLLGINSLVVHLLNVSSQALLPFGRRSHHFVNVGWNFFPHLSHQLIQHCTPPPRITKNQSHPSWQWYASNIWRKQSCPENCSQCSKLLVPPGFSLSWGIIYFKQWSWTCLKQPPTSSFVGWTLFSLKIILFSEVKKCKVSESSPASPLPALHIRWYIEKVLLSFPFHSLSEQWHVIFQWFVGIWASYTLGHIEEWAVAN